MKIRWAAGVIVVFSFLFIFGLVSRNYPASTPQKIAALSLACDRADVIETIKNLATNYIQSNMSYLLKFVRWPNFEAHSARGIFDAPIAYELSAFRDRGGFGASGKSCAVVAKATLKADIRLDLAGEYTVEPATDGKTIVTARFSPN